MRLSSTAFTIIFGLVSAAYAAPLDAGLDFSARNLVAGDSSRHEAHETDESLFARREFEHLEIREAGKSIDVTFINHKGLKIDNPISKDKATEVVKEFLDAVGHVFGFSDVVVNPKNEWNGSAVKIVFKFQHSVCGGSWCLAWTMGGGKGLITADGKHIFDNRK